MAKKRITKFPSIEELQKLSKEYNDKRYPEFNQLKEPFAKYALAMFVAELLLKNPKKITREQRQEVVREGNIARQSAYVAFNQILAVGIPDYYISYHLRPDLNKEEGE